MEKILHAPAEAISSLRATASPEALPVVVWLHSFATDHPWWTLAILALIAWEMVAFAWSQIKGG